MKPMTLLYAGLVVAASQVFAETAFRSVDEQGNVTFSDEPVSDAVQQEQITIDAPTPSQASQRDARQRAGQVEKAASQAGASGAADRAAEQKAARQKVQEAEQAYEEYASHPLAEAETAADVLAWDWASPDDWDVSGVREQCERPSGSAGPRHHLRYEVGGIFEWSWALRGFERFLMDLAEQPEMACAIMDRFTDVYIDYLTQIELPSSACPLFGCF